MVFFTGPTGTGKTELAKAIAAFLYGGASRLLRFDMSEYSGPDAAARLAGDRARPRGLLTSALSEQPFSVVLLDEIDKSLGDASDRQLERLGRLLAHCTQPSAAGGS